MKRATTFRGQAKPFGKKGHFHESRRHSLQARGIKTGKLIPLFPKYKITHLSRIQGNKSMNIYKKQYKELNKEFDALWELPDTPERTAMFKKKRMEKGYPLTRKVVFHREDPPKEIFYDFTDVPIVTMAQEGEGGHIEWIKPEDFLKLATPTAPSLSSIFYLYDAVQEGKPIPVGFIEVDKNNNVYGHEGRHRALMLRMFGIEEMPVAITGEGHDGFDVQRTRRERTIYDEELQDTDHDGFPDLYDCDPLDPTKQGMLQGRVTRTKVQRFI